MEIIGLMLLSIGFIFFLFSIPFIMENSFNVSVPFSVKEAYDITYENEILKFKTKNKRGMKVYTKDNTVFIIAKRVGYFDKYTNSYRFTDWEYDYDHIYYSHDEAYEALMYKRNHSDGNTEYKCDERI